MKTENSQKLKEESKSPTSVSSYGGYQYKREYEELIQSKTADDNVPARITAVVAIAVLFTVSVVAVAVLLIINILLTAPKISVNATETGKNVTFTGHSEPSNDDMSEQIIKAGKSSRAKIRAAGSELTGFFITSDGYIVTASSPLLESGDIFVNISENDVRAELVGMNESDGVAILKVDEHSLFAVDFGNEDNISSGDRVFVVNGGEKSGVSIGSISLCADGSFNIHGVTFDDSVFGAAVLNSNGVVVGVVTKHDGKVMNAISSSSVIPVIRQFVKDEITVDFSSKCKYIGQLGVTAVPVTDDESKRFGLPGGIMVVKIPPSSVGEKIGLMPNDIIIGIEGIAFGSVNEFEDFLEQYSGRSATLLVYRNERYIDVNFDVDG